MKIDAHHHFWQYHPREYVWMDDRMESIRRDFLPEHLVEEISSEGIDGVVSIQARQTVEETDWLLGLAEHYEFIKGVVGWVPLVDPNVALCLEKRKHDTNFKAVRHVLHDEPDPHYMLRDDFNRGISLLKAYDLVYDILVFESHLPQTITFVDRHPEQLFVVDHIAKPRIKEHQVEPWATLIRRLAERENCFCKLSGLITEADWVGWTEDTLKPYIEIVFSAFGPDRLMFGSDWPVCLVAGSYAAWCNTVRQFCTSLSAEEQARIWCGTAEEVYNL